MHSGKVIYIFRFYPQGFIFDVAGCCIFYANEDDMYYDFGFINFTSGLQHLRKLKILLG